MPARLTSLSKPSSRNSLVMSSRWSLQCGCLSGAFSSPNHNPLHKIMNRLVQFLFVLVCFFVVTPVLAQTGKIAGQVTEASTGDPLPGVSVVLDGTTQGAITDIDGFYTILNVRPGTYSVRASYLGYTPQVQQDVNVSIDLTTTLNFQLSEETVGLDEVVIEAERPVVQQDLSASRVDVTAEQMENLPVTDITEVVGTQAGVQGMNIRGDGANLSKVLVNGMDMSTRRQNNPYTGVSYASVEAVQVQSGGFSAKYGDMRAGVVNVITREGDRDRYSGTIIASYAPARKKYFGMNVNDPNSYWLRPYLDPQVAMVGTREGWDEFTQRQYPSWQGYNALSETLAKDSDPNNDLTPQQAQELFKYYHRRNLEIDQPDYVIDGAFGGPVPLVSRALGDLRFYASYRTEQNQYIIPLTDDGYNDYTGRLKLTSDIRPGMKLVIEGMMGVEKGTSSINRNNGTDIIKDGDRQWTLGTDMIASYNRPEDWMFGTGALTSGRIENRMIGGRFTHTLSSKSFYEVQLQRMDTKYRTTVPPVRDTTKVHCITPTYCVDEAPFNFSFEPSTSLENMRMGAHWSELRDTSDVVTYSGRFDFTSQVNRTNMIEAGIEFEVADMNINFGTPDFLLTDDDIYTKWSNTEIYGAAYIQDKLEFKGMIANVGLRLDYLDPNLEWYTFEDPYDILFSGGYVDSMDILFPKERVSPKVYLSPRVGLSFPITESSKLYFNYGHQRQRSPAEFLYQMRRDYISNRVHRIANPRAPLELTTSYELGYEQSLFNQFLIRIAGYYKDTKNQMRWVRFRDEESLVNYDINLPDNYADTRGIEISVFRNAGKWVRGFANYTYHVRSGGNFGFGQFLQNRQDQRNYERTTTDYYQSKPVPQPFARFNLEFLTPPDFGPGGGSLLGDWRLSLLGSWQMGPAFTWTGGQTSVQGVQNNMRWKDYRMVDMRIAKNFSVNGNNAQVYATIDNVFNLKNFNTGSFSDGNDQRYYLESLRLPKKMVEGWEHEYDHKDEQGNPIYGNDVPGDIGKDHIENPNYSSLWYLFPRTVNLGIRLSF